jgi:type I restriction enzyme M protein
MRNTDGLQPQEAFDELLKYLFFKQVNEEHGPQVTTSYALSSNQLFSENEARVAHTIRRLFSSYLDLVNSWSTQLWQERTFRLSDSTLSALHRLMGKVMFGEVTFDVRSAALKEFLPVEIRRGLGI